MPRNEHRPNVVLIVFDSCGATPSAAAETGHPRGDDFPAIPTPNLDRFAEQAIRFDRAFPEVLPTVTAGAPQVRDHVVTAWNYGVAGATDEWWLSIKANGKGALLHPIDQTDDPERQERHRGAPRRRTAAVRPGSTGGRRPVPEHILAAAGRREDAPGCSPVAAVALDDDQR
ncbi:hypothetical protein [Flindersiella endophytica]